MSKMISNLKYRDRDYNVGAIIPFAPTVNN